MKARARRWVIVVAALVGLIGIVWLATRHGPLSASGGEAFELELPSARHRQDDPRWAQDRLGTTNESFGAFGCTVSSVAMGSRPSASTIVTRITLPSGIEHWVLVVGKRGHDYLARDPLAPTSS